MESPDPTILALAGGLFIRVGNDLIGAIAVGGGAPETDEKCAQGGWTRFRLCCVDGIFQGCAAVFLMIAGLGLWSLAVIT
jgi:hypothetical protein